MALRSAAAESLAVLGHDIGHAAANRECLGVWPVSSM